MRWGYPKGQLSGATIEGQKKCEKTFISMPDLKIEALGSLLQGPWDPLCESVLQTLIFDCDKQMRSTEHDSNVHHWKVEFAKRIR